MHDLRFRITRRVTGPPGFLSHLAFAFRSFVLFHVLLVQLRGSLSPLRVHQLVLNVIELPPLISFRLVLLRLHLLVLQPVVLEQLVQFLGVLFDQCTLLHLLQPSSLVIASFSFSSFFLVFFFPYSSAFVA